MKHFQTPESQSFIRLPNNPPPPAQPLSLTQYCSYGQLGRPTLCNPPENYMTPWQKINWNTGYKYYFTFFSTSWHSERIFTVIHFYIQGCGIQKITRNQKVPQHEILGAHHLSLLWRVVVATFSTFTLQCDKCLHQELFQLWEM